MTTVKKKGKTLTPGFKQPKPININEKKTLDTHTFQHITAEKREIMTSLFTGNPAIPYIPKSEATKLSEKVFSSDEFSSLELDSKIVSNLEQMGMKSMTIVQQQAIPSILGGHDTLVKSQTGSGKSLTYALPIVHLLMHKSQRVQRSDGVLALIVVPTRELATQTYLLFEKLCKSCIWVVPGYLLGGEKKQAEKARLRRGINILVSTPGRLIDHLHSTMCLTLTSVKFLVIDEADRLLDMGYERSITSIIETLREHQNGPKTSYQTIMLSATLSANVEKLAGMTLVNPKVIDVSCEEGSEVSLRSDILATPANLSHHYVVVPAKLRLVTLAAFIISKCKFSSERKIIIFFATQDLVDYHMVLFSEVLSRYGEDSRANSSSYVDQAEKVLSGVQEEGSDQDTEYMKEEKNNKIIYFKKLHGKMTQQDRASVFKSFKKASSGVLMCTDIASRGLDLPSVSWIVQFNAPGTAADYVHRAGRTARVNTFGSALLFLAPAEVPYIHLLEKHKIMLQEISMQDILSNLILPSNYSTATTVEEAATELQVKVEKNLVNSNLYNLARKAYVSFVRSYASYPKGIREIFNIKALHLGHYAKSMGLKDSPAVLGVGAAFRAKKEMKEKRENFERKRKIQAMNQKCGKLPKCAVVSEFESGLESMPKSKKKKTR